MSDVDLEAFADELNLLRVRVMSGKGNGEDRDRWADMLEEWNRLVPDEAARHQLWVAAVNRWAMSDPPEIRRAREAREARARFKEGMKSIRETLDEFRAAIGEPTTAEREELEAKKVEEHIESKRHSRRVRSTSRKVNPDA